MLEYAWHFGLYPNTGNFNNAKNKTFPMQAKIRNPDMPNAGILRQAEAFFERIAALRVKRYLFRFFQYQANSKA